MKNQREYLDLWIFFALRILCDIYEGRSHPQTKIPNVKPTCVERKGKPSEIDTSKVSAFDVRRNGNKSYASRITITF